MTMHPQHQSLLYALALALALASALFLLLLGGLLVFNQFQGKVATLVNSREVVRLHDELRHRPKDEALKQRIRQLDLELRQRTFQDLQLSHAASRALIFGLVALLVGAHHARTFRRRLADPLAWGARPPDEERRIARQARYGVTGVFAFLALAAVAVALRPVRLPGPAVPVPAETPPTSEEIRQNWATFRGPNGQGVAPSAALPLPGNIRWKIVVPLHGMSSPVRWGNGLFLTGASATENRVFRIDAETGALVWSVAVHLPGGVRAPNPKVGDETGLAASTPATDGRRVYAIFANGELAAIDFDGKPVWVRNVGPLENAYGYASSLALDQDRLMIQIDRGSAADGQSKLIALDSRTGQDRWEVSRDVAGSWASPIVAEINQRPQLITCATPAVIAYNPADGRELWRVNCLENDCAPSPIFAGGLVVAVAPNSAIFALRPGSKVGQALRPGAQGRVASSLPEKIWQSTEGVPEATSPVSDGQRLYTIDSAGVLTCFNLQTGRVLWTHEFDDRFYASPTILGHALVLVSRKGVAYGFETSDQLHALGQAALGEECNASPVPYGRRLYVRGAKHLFCLEAGGK